jgi:hypothetical protein
VELGQRVEAQVLVVSNDEDLTYEWYTDIGTFDDPSTTDRVFWNAPEMSSENQAYVGQFPTLMVTVTDSLGQSTTGFGNVLLTSEVTTAYSPVVQNTNNGGGGCSQLNQATGMGSLMLSVLFSGLALVGIRRRS